METSEDLQYWGVNELIEYILELQDKVLELEKKVED